jgi:hypothetical protein
MTYNAWVLPNDHEDSYQIHQVGGCIVESGNNTSQSKASIGQNISNINVSIIEMGVSPDTSQLSLLQFDQNSGRWCFF